MRTTPPPPIDVTRIAPEIAPLARTTVRLHPRHGASNPGQSKISGHVLWPRSVEWPRCEEHGTALVAVLQLLKEDVPELGFPSGVTIFQLFWCPLDHKRLEPRYAPNPQVFWHRKGKGLVPRFEPPPEGADQNYIPTECVLHPERVIEYPDISELAIDWPDTSTKIESAAELLRVASTTPELLSGDPSYLYQVALSIAPGIKVGGYPHWVQDPDRPKCDRCNDGMEYLLTIDSTEFDGASWRRWLPVEDRAVHAADYAIRSAVQRAGGLMLGDMGNLNLFICRSCPDSPTKSVFQCS